MAPLITFYALALVTIASALVTAFSRNIVHSAFALFGTLAGVAGIYALLAADFLFIIQIFIYIGGILVVTIFAVMLTQGLAEVNVSNRAVGILPALVTVALAGAVMGDAIIRTILGIGPNRGRLRRPLTESGTRSSDRTSCLSRSPRLSCWLR